MCQFTLRTSCGQHSWLFLDYQHAICLCVLFSGTSSVPSMQSVTGLLYSLYRITLVDEYEYSAMFSVDDVMAPLLCGTFLAASSILCVNLFIALLSDTFQRSEVTPEATNSGAWLSCQS